MQKSDFNYIAESMKYQITVNEISVTISEEDMCEENIVLADKILQAYPYKIDDIAQYLSEHEDIIQVYGNLSKDEIAAKLHEPVITVDETGGVLSYCRHELDDIHIIDLEFGGNLEKFYYVNIDG